MTALETQGVPVWFHVMPDYLHNTLNAGFQGWLQRDEIC